jgi:hypothetical protein
MIRHFLSRYITQTMNDTLGRVRKFFPVSKLFYFQPLKKIQRWQPFKPTNQLQPEQTP